MTSFSIKDSATTECYTLSLHDALPISVVLVDQVDDAREREPEPGPEDRQPERLAEAVVLRIAVEHRQVEDQEEDRKSTRLNSSHGYISYAVFCLKKKKNSTHLTSCMDC